jgi:group I intron endonuclease
MIIYKTTNLVNNKIYVGLDSKNNPNYLGSGVKIKLAIKKYGKDKFKKEILEECLNKTIDEVKRIEVYWIKKLDSANPKIGYNIRDVEVYTNYGIKRTEEFKEKLRKRLSGKNNPNYGKKMSEEKKEYLRQKMSGKNSPRFGKHHTEEVKKKLSEKRKGKPISDKARQNMRANDKQNNPMFGKNHSQKTKDLISASKKGQVPWNKGLKNIYSDDAIKKMKNKIGCIWVYNIKTNKSKQINKNELHLYTKDGWIKGRKQKK